MHVWDSCLTSSRLPKVAACTVCWSSRCTMTEGSTPALLSHCLCGDLLVTLHGWTNPTLLKTRHPLQVRLLYDGKERGRMYAAYALSSIMSPTSSLMDMRAAGAIPALISVLNTSKVSLAALRWCCCTAQTAQDLLRKA